MMALILTTIVSLFIPYPSEKSGYQICCKISHSCRQLDQVRKKFGRKPIRLTSHLLNPLCIRDIQRSTFKNGPTRDTHITYSSTYPTCQLLPHA
jgi:hypothetical protein